MIFINSYYDIKKKLLEHTEIYKIENKSEILNIQINKFNKVWKEAYTQFSFYKNFKNLNKLPNEIKNLKELNDFPTINKFDINKNFSSILNDSQSKKITKTGGTSGLVSYFPTGYMDSKNNFNKQNYLRKKFGINYDSRCLYIWGHSHKFNNNLITKNINILKKNLKNYLFNRKQISAYEFDDRNIQEIISYIQSDQYDYILTYASTIDILMNYLFSHKIILKNKIKIITTSETLDKNTIKLIITHAPNFELINEYGMAETGVIGYNLLSNYSTISSLWFSYLLQEENGKLILNTLDKKVFPLIRYDPDDYIETKDKESIFNFQIRGKERPLFTIKKNNSNRKISSIVFDHILKNINGIYSVQYHYSNDQNLFIIYSSKNKLDESFLINVLNKKLNFRFDNIFIKWSEKPIKTIAGKFKYIINKDDYNKLIN